MLQGHRRHRHRARPAEGMHGAPTSCVARAAADRHDHDQNRDPRLLCNDLAALHDDRDTRLLLHGAGDAELGRGGLLRVVLPRVAALLRADGLLAAALRGAALYDRSTWPGVAPVTR